MRTDPLLVQTGNEVILIDAGIGNGMIEGKQKNILALRKNLT